jgi:PAS domain S-box-containing protein
MSLNDTQSDKSQASSATPDPLADALADDVTGQIQARLAAIIESSDDAIVSKNLDGIVMSWNKGAERIFGYSAEEMIGRPINILVPSDRKEEEPSILRRIRAGERIDHFETLRVRKDGRLIDVSVTISPIRNARGQIVGASKVARDITQQNQTRKELQAAKEAAEAANLAKDHFLSVLSHELRTPLTPVLAEVSLLEALPQLSDDLRTRLGMVRRNVETEARLVDDLLDVTRISRGNVRLQQEVVDLHEALRLAVAMMQSDIDAKELEVTIGLRAREHHVWADAGRMQQVFLNLLSNAVKFTPQGGSIALHTSSLDNGKRVRAQITDTGMGIEADGMHRLFTAFEQTDKARRFGGLGLGLSICKAMIGMHHGTIVASSAGAGKGSTFTVELQTVPREQRAKHVGNVPLQAGAGCRVLLVEDHEDTRLVMTRLLQSFGCVVVAVGSVSEALSSSEKNEFDLLISDIGLPDGTGMQLMQRLKASKAMRGIALSGFGHEDDLRRSEEAGFEMHLTKPINLQTLRETVQRVWADRLDERPLV